MAERAAARAGAGARLSRAGRHQAGTPDPAASGRVARRHRGRNPQGHRVLHGKVPAEVTAIRQSRRARLRPDGERNRPGGGGRRVRGDRPGPERGAARAREEDDRAVARPNSSRRPSSRPTPATRHWPGSASPPRSKTWPAADLVIEAVTEDLELKNRQWTALDLVCPPETIFASNTSSLSIMAMATRDRPAGAVHRAALLQPGADDAAGGSGADASRRRGRPSTRPPHFVRRLGKEPIAATGLGRIHRQPAADSLPAGCGAGGGAGRGLDSRISTPG